VPESADPEKRRWTRILTTAGVIIGVVAGAVGLVFTIAPQLKPCLGDSSVVFTGAPVFPHVNFRDHLIRSGIAKEKVVDEPNEFGAEVRFSYRTSGFRGGKLAVTWSLIAIERDGTLGPVVPGQDRALATTVTPQTCSEAGGRDLFVSIPNPRARYRVVLELYRDRRLRDRVALTETAPFRG
jgi:hypothetical protein